MTNAQLGVVCLLLLAAFVIGLAVGYDVGVRAAKDLNQ